MTGAGSTARGLARGIGLSLGSAVLLGISQPFYMPETWQSYAGICKYLGLLSLVGYVPLLYLIHDKSLKATFWWVVLSLSAYFSLVLYWLYIALHVHGGVYPPLAVLITYLVPLILSLMCALFTVLGRFLSMHFGRPMWVFAPFAITSADYFRNYFFFGGFPWGNVGYSLGQVDEFLQLASVVGVYGLVFFVAAINAMICGAIVTKKSNLKKALLAASVVLPLVVYGGGYLRLSLGKHQFAPSVRVALLQGNIAQHVKGVPSNRRSILEIYQDLNRKAKAKGADLIVWPETAYPLFLDENALRVESRGEEDIASIVGSSAYGEGEGAHLGEHYHNAAFLVDYLGHVVKRYDKTHLVPFGEYVPWPFYGLVDKVVPGIGAWRPGNDFTPVLLEIAPHRYVSVGTSICYEGIFPEISRAYAKKGATLLVNLTNDAWYDRSSAPFQHFMMYRLRSVESGRPFVRATNSGISGWIDAYGNVRDRSPLFEELVLVDDVPLITRNTIYLYIGDMVPIVCMLLMVIGFMLSIVPVHKFVKNKQYGKLVLLLVLAIVAFLGYVYYSQERFAYDESAGTKKLLIYVFCLLFMVGFLHKSKRSALVLKAFAIFFLTFSLLLSMVESPVFLLGVCLSVLIYYLAFRMKYEI